METNLKIKTRLGSVLWILLLWSGFAFSSLHAEETVCAVVKIEIKQELTLERQAFDAHMRIDNHMLGIQLDDLSYRCIANCVQNRKTHVLIQFKLMQAPKMALGDYPENSS